MKGIQFKIGTFSKEKLKVPRISSIVPSAWSLAVLVCKALSVLGDLLFCLHCGNVRYCSLSFCVYIYPVNNIVCDLDCNFNTSTCFSKCSVKQMLY